MTNTVSNTLAQQILPRPAPEKINQIHHHSEMFPLTTETFRECDRVIKNEYTHKDGGYVFNNGE